MTTGILDPTYMEDELRKLGLCAAARIRYD